MELIDLMKKISQNDIPHFIIMFGEEQKIADVYIDRICQNRKKVFLDNVSQAIKQTNRKSLDKTEVVFVVTEDKGILSVENIWNRIQDNFKHNILILRYHTLDKRGKFYSNLKQNSVEFTHLSEEVLSMYIKKAFPDFMDKNAINLIEFCSNDWGRICMELDKIKNYQEVTKKSSNNCFEILDKQGIFKKEIGDITFELTNAVLGGYTQTAMKKLHEAKLKGESTIIISSILYNGFRNLLAYQGCGKDKTNIMQKTGLTKGEIYRCSKLSGGYNIKELIRNIFVCQKVESGIKTGTIEEDIALEYMVLSCLR